MMWASVYKYPKYTISINGCVLGCRGKPIKQWMNSRGYMLVTLHKHKASKRITVHKLVLETFMSERPKGKECNHIDGKKTNNCLSNLEWVTPTENQKHAFRMGLKADQRGENHPIAKLKNIDVLSIRTLKECYRYPQKKLATLFDVSLANIEAIVQRKTWRHI